MPLRLTLDGFGDPSRASCAVFAGWLEGAARASGARSVDIQEEGCRVQGQADCAFVATWTI